MNPGPLKRPRSGVGGVAWQSHQQPLCRASARGGGEGDGKSGGAATSLTSRPLVSKKPGWERKRRRRKGWVRGRVRSPAEEEPGPSRRYAGVTRAKKVKAILCRPLTPLYTPPSSALPHAPAQPPPPRARWSLKPTKACISPLTRPAKWAGLPSLPLAVHTHAYRGAGASLKLRPRPPPRAAAGASPALRGSRARHSHKMSALTELLPAATLRPSPLLLPLHRRVSVRQRRRREHRTNLRVKGDRLLPTSRAEFMLPPFPSFRNSTFLLNRSEIGLGGRGPEAGHGLGGRVDERRKPSDSEKHREPEGDHGRKKPVYKSVRKHSYRPEGNS
ncbi:uncharacterized protein LOC115301511 [Suricata suricatta]|uniref:uncharacterized protein LOC115301511 n=1 Tax=Suricata suricatta TaxID=37032 RepID=UPI001155D2BA|nr:uncharacterized protein LOC115301511 [Suricata suricatta]